MGPTTTLWMAPMFIKEPKLYKTAARTLWAQIDWKLITLHRWKSNKSWEHIYFEKKKRIKVGSKWWARNRIAWITGIWVAWRKRGPIALQFSMQLLHFLHRLVHDTSRCIYHFESLRWLESTAIHINSTRSLSLCKSSFFLHLVLSQLLNSLSLSLSNGVALNLTIPMPMYSPLIRCNFIMLGTLGFCSF